MYQTKMTKNDIMKMYEECMKDDEDETGCKPTFATPKNPIKVMGLRVLGEQITPEMVQVDKTFEYCPIAHAAGIPLFVKRLVNQKTNKCQRYAIVRIMSRPQTGLAAMNWQYGGMLPPAPPVLVARSDLVQFNYEDWCVLDDFQMVMLDDGPRKVTKKDYIAFIKDRFILNKQEIGESNLVAQALFPKGGQCQIHSLKKDTQLNCKTGKILGSYQKGRVGIHFEDLQRSCAIKPQNMRLKGQLK